LAQNIGTVDSGWNTFLLNLRWIFEASFVDRSEKFILEQEVLERSGMGANVSSRIVRLGLGLCSGVDGFFVVR